MPISYAQHDTDVQQLIRAHLISDSCVIRLVQTQPDVLSQRRYHLVITAGSPNDAAGGSVQIAVSGLTGTAATVTRNCQANGNTYNCAWNAGDFCALVIPQITNLNFDANVRVETTSNTWDGQILMAEGTTTGWTDIRKVSSQEAEAGIKLAASVVENTCAPIKDCYTCATKPECGWCKTRGECLLGTASGPFPQEGSCEVWQWSFDNAVSRRISYELRPNSALQPVHYNVFITRDESDALTLDYKIGVSRKDVSSDLLLMAEATTQVTETAMGNIIRAVESVIANGIAGASRLGFGFMTFTRGANPNCNLVIPVDEIRIWATRQAEVKNALEGVRNRLPTINTGNSAPFRCARSLSQMACAWRKNAHKTAAIILTDQTPATQQELVELGLDLAKADITPCLIATPALVQYARGVVQNAQVGIVVGVAADLSNLRSAMDKCLTRSVGYVSMVLDPQTSRYITNADLETKTIFNVFGADRYRVTGCITLAKSAPTALVSEAFFTGAGKMTVENYLNPDPRVNIPAINAVADKATLVAADISYPDLRAESLPETKFELCFTSCPSLGEIRPFPPSNTRPYTVTSFDHVQERG
jgi:hypothetical protein